MVDLSSFIPIEMSILIQMNLGHQLLQTHEWMGAIQCGIDKLCLPIWRSRFKLGWTVWNDNCSWRILCKRTKGQQLDQTEVKCKFIPDSDCITAFECSLCRGTPKLNCTDYWLVVSVSMPRKFCRTLGWSVETWEPHTADGSLRWKRRNPLLTQLETLPFCVVGCGCDATKRTAKCNGADAYTMQPHRHQSLHIE